MKTSRSQRSACRCSGRSVSLCGGVTSTLSVWITVFVAGQCTTTTVLAQSADEPDSGGSSSGNVLLWSLVGGILGLAFIFGVALCVLVVWMKAKDRRIRRHAASRGSSMGLLDTRSRNMSTLSSISTNADPNTPWRDQLSRSAETTMTSVDGSLSTLALQGSEVLIQKARLQPQPAPNIVLTFRQSPGTGAKSATMPVEKNKHGVNDVESTSAFSAHVASAIATADADRNSQDMELIWPARMTPLAETSRECSRDSTLQKPSSGGSSLARASNTSTRNPSSLSRGGTAEKVANELKEQISTGAISELATDGDATHTTAGTGVSDMHGGQPLPVTSTPIPPTAAAAAAATAAADQDSAGQQGRKESVVSVDYPENDAIAVGHLDSLQRALNREMIDTGDDIFDQDEAHVDTTRDHALKFITPISMMHGSVGDVPEEDEARVGAQDRNDDTTLVSVTHDDVTGLDDTNEAQCGGADTTKSTGGTDVVTAAGGVTVELGQQSKPADSAYAENGRSAVELSTSTPVPATATMSESTTPSQTLQDSASGEIADSAYEDYTAEDTGMSFGLDVELWEASEAQDEPEQDEVWDVIHGFYDHSASKLRAATMVSDRSNVDEDLEQLNMSIDTLQTLRRLEAKERKAAKNMNRKSTPIVHTHDVPSVLDIFGDRGEGAETPEVTPMDTPLGTQPRGRAQSTPTGTSAAASNQSSLSKVVDNAEKDFLEAPVFRTPTINEVSDTSENQASGSLFVNPMYTPISQT